MSKVIEAPNLGALLQQFFTEYLIQQRAASPCTIASYRDTFCLLFAFTERKLGKRPTALCLENITADLILEFLEYLEKNATTRFAPATFAAQRFAPSCTMSHARRRSPSPLPSLFSRSR
jgi:site-specific recombinase XerD